MTITVFRDIDLKGPSITFYTSTPDLRDFGWNDTISSFVIQDGSWMLYESVDYTGTSTGILSKGIYKDIRHLNFGNDTASSIRSFN